MIRQRPFALIVCFDIEPALLTAFETLVRANAAESMRREPGCLRFDVLSPQDGDPPQIELYEIYVDRAAFDLHLQAPHYLTFDRAVADMVRAKSVRFFDVEQNAVAANPA